VQLVQLQSLLGICVLIAGAWAMSEDRRAFNWRFVAGTLLLQGALALILLKVPIVRDLLFRLNGLVAVLTTATGAGTIPQIFIGGEYVGGSTDLFRGWRDGSIQRRLTANGIRYDAEAAVNPEDLLPKWLQPRCAT